MTSTTFFIIFIPILAIILLAVNLVLAPHNPGIWLRKSNIRDNLPNSGEPLKLLIPSHIWKYMSGWTNYSEMVTSQKIYEKIMGNRGSKSDNIISVKEQRVDGSWCGNTLPHLRCTLAGFESNYKGKILSKLIYYTSLFSQHKAKMVKKLF